MKLTIQEHRPGAPLEEWENVEHVEIVDGLADLINSALTHPKFCDERKKHLGKLSGLNYQVTKDVFLTVSPGGTPSYQWRVAPKLYVGYYSECISGGDDWMVIVPEEGVSEEPIFARHSPNGYYQLMNDQRGFSVLGSGRIVFRHEGAMFEFGTDHPCWPWIFANHRLALAVGTLERFLSPSKTNPLTALLSSQQPYKTLAEQCLTTLQPVLAALHGKMKFG